MKWTLCLFFVASVATAMPQNKKGKAFSLFSVVTFPNVECTTTMTPAMKGTCVTQEECQNTGNTVATASGNCASGFGVCCFRRITEPGAVTESLTHIQSEGFPTPVTALAADPVTPLNRAFPIMTDSSVCAVKFDFINVQLADPAAAGTCGDTLTVATPARNQAAGFVPGALCGVLTGQHMYVDVNTAGGAMAATININNDNTAFNRVWKILVQRIACDSPDLPPAGCLQFFTGLSGLITSFNGARMNNAHQMIQNQHYRVCIKRGAGMCGVRYREADATIDSFGLGANAAAGAAGEFNGKSGIGAQCTAAGHTFITVQPIGKICGGVLSPVKDQAKTGPVTSNEFGLTVTAPNALATQAGSGFNLIYNQVACN
jgi:hypothetical protein